MKYVDIKALKPGDIIYKRENGEPCEILGIMRDQCGDIAVSRAYSQMLRFRFWGFDVFAPAMHKIFMSTNNLIAAKIKRLLL